MKNKPLCKLATRLLIVLVLLTSWLVMPEFQPHRVLAQTHTPFLITPYYGNHNVIPSHETNSFITSYFDHRSPNYTENTELIRYDGRRYTNNVDKGHCTGGLNCYDGHNGYDFDLYYEPVLAASSGTVKYASWDDGACRTCGYGLYVRIEHSTDSGLYRTRYGHLTTIAVTVGQSVRAGQIIGTSGSTGGSGGPHLHFDVEQYINGIWRAVDPFGWQSINPQIPNDPWTSATSWCMWADGELASFCGRPSRPILPPTNGGEVIVDDTTNNSGGFSKGYGGLWSNPCTGVNPGCRDWYESPGTGIGNHTYRSIADGFQTVDNWSKWQPNSLPGYSGLYEIYVWIPSTPGIDMNTYSWQAKFMVFDSISTFTTLVDERPDSTTYHNPNDKWLSIGIFFMTGNGYVYTTDATGEIQNQHCPTGPNGWCRMTADAVKFVRRGTTYIPNFKKHGSGWDTEVYIRGNGGGQARTKISWFDANGNYLCPDYPYIESNRTLNVFSPCNQSNAASLVIDSDQDVSAIAFHSSEDLYVYAAYKGITTRHTDIHVPIVHKNNYGWSSDIVIQNQGFSSTSVSVDLLPLPGSYSNFCGTLTQSLAAQQQWTISVKNLGCLSSTFVGSAWIRASSPLAVVSGQFHYNGYGQVDTLMESDYAANAASRVFAPLIQNYNYSWYSGIAAQNASLYTNSLRIYYLFMDSGAICTAGTKNLDNVLPHYSRAEPYPPGTGTCNSQVLSGYVKDYGPNYPVTAVINQLKQNTTQGTDYPAIASPGSIVTVPRWFKNHEGWTSGLVIQNVESSSIHATVIYYDAYGNIPDGGILPVDLGANQSIVINSWPTSLSIAYGSVVIIVDNNKKVAVAVNHVQYGTSVDGIMSHTGIHR